MTVRTTRARVAALAAVAATLLLFPAIVAAHAELLEATPADGATVEGTPAEISATFDEPLLTDGSTFSIRNAAGERLAVGQIDPDDSTRLIIDPVPELAPGKYEIRWRAATADGHAENDTWTFTVTAAPTPAPTPEPTAASSASAEPTPSATPEPSTTAAASPSASPGPSDPAGASDGDVILPIIAALAIVLVAAGFLLSRRGRPSDGV
jgi:methionine-rich copper-binding protein CopC